MYFQSGMRASVTSSSSIGVPRRKWGFCLPWQYQSQTQILGQIYRDSSERNGHGRVAKVSITIFIKVFTHITHTHILYLSILLLLLSLSTITKFCPQAQRIRLYNTLTHTHIRITRRRKLPFQTSFSSNYHVVMRQKVLVRGISHLWNSLIFLDLLSNAVCQLFFFLLIPILRMHFI